MKRLHLGTFHGYPVALLFTPRKRLEEIPADTYLEWGSERLNLDRLQPRHAALVPHGYGNAPLEAFLPLLRGGEPMSYPPDDRFSDLNKQGFMRAVYAQRKPKPKAKPERPIVACNACGDWHRKGKHTKAR